MCNCIKEIEDKVLTELVEKNPKYKNRKIIKANLDNVVIMFLPKGKASVQLYSPMKIEYEYLNKNQEAKIKKDTINMSCTFCPFCGQKYESR